MQKKLLITLILITLRTVASACDACEKQQPEFTRGITHGAGPTGSSDWIIVAAMLLVSVITLFLSLKYLIRPGERDKSHIKNSIL